MFGQCIVCGSSHLAPLVEITDVPVHCNVVCNTREEALATPRGRIDLVLCHGCGHVFNRAFDPGRMHYDAAYENSLFGSPKFRGYANALADRLIADHDLHDKDIVEIGCGDGRFLELICGKGANHGLGFDPGGQPRKRGAHGEDVRVFADMYGESYRHYGGDAVICRHVLEHISDPGAFVDRLCSAAKNASSNLYIEVPNGRYTLEWGLVWDLIYEHCSYFSETSLARLLSNCGLVVDRLRSDYGDQFLCVDAGLIEKGGRGGFDGPIPEALDQIDLFGRRIDETIRVWRERLAALAGRGATIVAWGAGSKGVTFLNLVDRGDGLVHHIVDVNPKKWGRFVAGTGQEIVWPGALRAIRPDLVLLMNPLYQDEVREHLARLGVTTAVEVIVRRRAWAGAAEDARRRVERHRSLSESLEDGVLEREVASSTV